jgi:sugar porter (SP) family MFS transporter
VINSAKAEVAKAEAITGSIYYNRVYVWTISVVAALGGLLFGYDWIVIAGAKPFYEKYFHLVDPSQQGWAMSCAVVGCLTGAIISGALSDKFGRKRLLMGAALLFAVTSVGTAFTHEFRAFVIWRICGGAAIGLASNLSPMYIAEVAPAEVRGKLVSFNQLTIVIGVLLAQLDDWLIARRVPPDATADYILHSWNGQVGWRWMFGVTAVFAMLFFIAILTVPESPRWLAKNGKPERAREVLQKVGGEAYSRQALAEIEASLRDEVARVNYGDLLEPGVRRALALGVFLAVLQQWCGINIVFSYAEEVFAAAGYKINDILFNIVIMGATGFVFTLVAMAWVDRVGRRKLLLIGSAGMAVCYLVLGAGYHAGRHGLYILLVVLASTGFFDSSLGPVVWVVIAEIFPNRIRGAAMAIAVSTLWIASFVVIYTFPLLNHALGTAQAFWIYSLVCVIGFIFIKLRLPETKGKTLEEIERLL